LNPELSETRKWFVPELHGDVPERRSMFGFASSGKRIFLHGGMSEVGKVNNQIYELSVSRAVAYFQISKFLSEADLLLSLVSSNLKCDIFKYEMIWSCFVVSLKFE
jgi:hypothetical protein